MFIFFIFLILLYISQLIFFVNITKSLKTNWKILIFVFLYVVENLFGLFFLHFIHGRNFIFYILETMQKNTVLKDPQDFLYILFNTGNFVLFLSFGFISLFLVHLFFVNMLRYSEYVFSYFVVMLFFYLFLIGFCIFFSDLITTHWEIFYQDKTFDFQPDLIRWFKYYKGEFYDLFVNLGLWGFIGLFSLLFFSTSLRNELFSNTTFSFYYRIALIFFLLIIVMTFFGGESLFRDLILFFCSCFLSELTFFSLLFFRTLKRYKFPSN